MSLQDIIVRRLVKALTKIADPGFPVGPETTLGGVPPAGLGFDSNALRQVLAELNGSQVGFGDLLEQRLIQDEVKVSTKVSDLATAILKKSSVKTDAEYEVKVSERVRLGLRQVIAEMTNVDEMQILPTDNITKFLPLTPANVDRIRREMTAMLERYLFSSITRSDIQGTIGRIQRNIVDRMLL